MRARGWQARLAQPRRRALQFGLCDQQRGFGLIECLQTLAQVAGHARFHQGITQRRSRQQAKQKAEDQRQQQYHATLALHGLATGLRIATLMS
ncbi:hypothetical protein D3C76_1472910 [compost metagenome]